MIPRHDPIANPFRKSPNTAIFNVLPKTEYDPSIRSARDYSRPYDGSPSNLSYKGKPPTSPYLNGSRNNNYNNPSLLSNEVFYSSEYSVPYQAMIQHKPISPFRIQQKSPEPQRQNPWHHNYKPESSARSLSPAPTLPPVIRQEFNKWLKEGGGFSPITHLPNKPLPSLNSIKEKAYSQPNGPVDGNQMSSGTFGGRNIIQGNNSSRSKTPTPTHISRPERKASNDRVYEASRQERSMTPVRSSNEVPAREQYSERKDKEAKVKFSEPNEFSIKPISINKEPVSEKKLNFHFAPQNPINQQNDEQWKKSLASRRPTRKNSNNSRDDLKTPINTSPGYNRENSQSSPDIRNRYHATEPSWSPQRVKTPQEVKNLNLSGNDDLCANCVNQELIEKRKMKAVYDKLTDKEKERILSIEGMNKKKAEEELAKEKRSKLVEGTRVLQKALENEYEKKLEARRNKGENVQSRNLFEGIFERQDELNQRQREIFRAGLRGMQEQSDPNRKKSPKEKFWEILEQKQARQYGDGYNNKHLPSANEVVSSWKDQLNYKEEKKRREKQYDQVFASEVNKIEQMKIEQERNQITKKVHDLREQTRAELNENLARKEAKKEEDKNRKVMEKQMLEKQTEEYRRRKLEEENQRKKRILDEQRKAMKEAAQDAFQKKEKEREWLMNQKRLGYDGSVLNNMGKEKQREMKCCANCNKQFKTACLKKGHDFF